MSVAIWEFGATGATKIDWIKIRDPSVNWQVELYSFSMEQMNGVRFRRMDDDERENIKEKGKKHFCSILRTEHQVIV